MTPFDRSVREIRGLIGRPDSELAAVNALMKAVGAQKGIVISHHSDGSPGTLIQGTHFDADHIRSYNDVYAPQNPLGPIVPKFPIGAVHCLTDFIPIRTHRRMPYFAHANRHFGVYEIGGVVYRRGIDLTAISIANSLGKGDFRSEHRRTIVRLMREVRRLFLLARWFPTDTHLTRTLLDLLAKTNAVFLLDERAAVVDHNAAADDHLREAVHVYNEKGRLRFRNPKVDRVFARSIQREPVAEFESTQRVRATLVSVADTDLGSGISAKLLLLPALQSTLFRIRVEAFADRHALTSTECAILEALSLGASLSQVAQSRGRSIETCRNQIKQVRPTSPRSASARDHRGRLGTSDRPYRPLAHLGHEHRPKTAHLLPSRRSTGREAAPTCASFANRRLFRLSGMSDAQTIASGSVHDHAPAEVTLGIFGKTGVTKTVALRHNWRSSLAV